MPKWSQEERGVPARRGAAGHWFAPRCRRPRLLQAGEALPQPETCAIGESPAQPLSRALAAPCAPDLSSPGLLADVAAARQTEQQPVPRQSGARSCFLVSPAKSGARSPAVLHPQPAGVMPRGVAGPTPPPAHPHLAPTSLQSRAPRGTEQGSCPRSPRGAVSERGAAPKNRDLFSAFARLPPLKIHPAGADWRRNRDAGGVQLVSDPRCRPSACPGQSPCRLAPLGAAPSSRSRSLQLELTRAICQR